MSDRTPDRSTDARRRARPVAFADPAWTRRWTVQPRIAGRMVLVSLAAGALVALMLDGSCAGAAEVAAMKAYAASPKWPPPPREGRPAPARWFAPRRNPSTTAYATCASLVRASVSTKARKSRLSRIRIFRTELADSALNSPFALSSSLRRSVANSAELSPPGATFALHI
jgi:hypothetical protein